MWWNRKPKPLVKHRLDSKYHKMLKLLKRKHECTNWELNQISFRYSALIHEMRKAGFIIVTNKINGDGLYTYTYKGKRG